MATTSFATGDVNTVKRWSDRLERDVTTDTEYVSEMITDGILKQQNELSKEAGDEVKYTFLRRLSSKGLIGDASATGNEKALTYDQAVMKINRLRQVVQVPADGTISAQRVIFNLPEDAYETLRNYIKERFIISTFNQLAGNVATSITYDGETFSTATELLEITGMNVCVAPSSNNQIWANGNTVDSGVNGDTAAKFSLTLIDEAEAKARKNRPYLLALNATGIMYRCYLHVDGFKQLIQDVSAPIQYRDIYLNKIASGKSNELFGTRFQYSQTEIIVTDKVPNGVATVTAQTNVRRAVFVGKQAGAIAYGKGASAGGKTTAGFNFKDDLIDIGDQKRIAVSAVMGISKTQFNSVDRGVITISHYVA
jgi:hypothetical protein